MSKNCTKYRQESRERHFVKSSSESLAIFENNTQRKTENCLIYSIKIRINVQSKMTSKSKTKRRSMPILDVVLIATY